MNRESPHLLAETLLIASGLGVSLAFYGIGVWNSSVVLHSGALFDAPHQSFIDLYLAFTSVGMLAGILLRAALSLLSNSNRLWHEQIICSLIIATEASLVLPWGTSAPTVCAVGFLVGCSFGCLSVFWVVSVYESRIQTQVVLPLSLFFASLANACYVLALPSMIESVMALSLLFAGVCSIVLVRLKGVAEERGSSCNVRRLSCDFNLIAVELRDRYAPLFRRFTETLLCVVTLQIIAPTMNYMGLADSLTGDGQLKIVCAAQASAAIATFLVLRLTSSGSRSAWVFKYVTPVLILMLFLVPFAGSTYAVALLLVGSCLHFVAIYALFCTDAMSIARGKSVAFEFFYATGFFVLMAVCVILENLMPLLLRASTSAELLVTFGVFLCIYVLSMAFMATRPKRQDPAASDVRPPEPTEPPELDAHAGALATVCKRHQLSDREAEILELILRGKNVPSIAEELVISQNTVRSHVKRIYRATNVHTRQELISYCEGVGQGE